MSALAMSAEAHLHSGDGQLHSSAGNACIRDYELVVIASSAVLFCLLYSSSALNPADGPDVAFSVWSHAAVASMGSIYLQAGAAMPYLMPFGWLEQQALPSLCIHKASRSLDVQLCDPLYNVRSALLRRQWAVRSRCRRHPATVTGSAPVKRCEEVRRDCAGMQQHHGDAVRLQVACQAHGRHV